jgi:hypothetical protein
MYLQRRDAEFLARDFAGMSSLRSESQMANLKSQIKFSRGLVEELKRRNTQFLTSHLSREDIETLPGFDDHLAIHPVLASLGIDSTALTTGLKWQISDLK